MTVSSDPLPPIPSSWPMPGDSPSTTTPSDEPPDGIEVQRERLDNLRLAAQCGRQPAPEPTEVPPHLRHAHYATDRGPDPCACGPDCTYCYHEEDSNAHA